MFGRKKERPERPTGRPARLDPQKMMRVWAAFLDDPGPSAAPGGPAPVPAPPVGGFGASVPAPPPPLGGGPAGSSGFVFNITPFSGSEANLANNPSGGPVAGGTFNVPGLGTVNAQQMQAASERLQGLIREVMGADAAALDHTSAWGPQQARTALDRLPGLHAEGRINTEQFEAVKDLLESVAGPPGS